MNGPFMHMTRLEAPAVSILVHHKTRSGSQAVAWLIVVWLSLPQQTQREIQYHSISRYHYTEQSMGCYPVAKPLSNMFPSGGERSTDKWGKVPLGLAILWLSHCFNVVGNSSGCDSRQLLLGMENPLRMDDAVSVQLFHMVVGIV